MASIGEHTQLWAKAGESFKESEAAMQTISSSVMKSSEFVEQVTVKCKCSHCVATIGVAPAFPPHFKLPSYKALPVWVG